MRCGHAILSCLCTPLRGLQTCPAPGRNPATSCVPLRQCSPVWHLSLWLYLAVCWTACELGVVGGFQLCPLQVMALCHTTAPCCEPQWLFMAGFMLNATLDVFLARVHVSPMVRRVRWFNVPFPMKMSCCDTFTPFILPLSPYHSLWGMLRGSRWGFCAQLPSPAFAANSGLPGPFPTRTRCTGKA